MSNVDAAAATAARARGAPVSRSAGLALVALAAVLWSGGGVGVKVVSLPAMSIAGFRSAFAAVTMLLVVSARRTLAWRDAMEIMKRRRVWIAALSYALMVVCFCVSAKKTTAANAIFIQYTGPIYVALLSQPILGERVRRKDWIATLASVVGMALFFRGEIDATGKIGNLVAMLSSFGFAGLPLAIRSEERALAATGEARPESPVVAMILGNVIATAACLPVMAGSPPHVGVELGALVALGALQIALPYLLYGIAVRALSALESSLVAMIEPVLSPVWVLFATGERPSRDAILGGAIILAAVLFRSVSRAPPSAPERR